MYQKLRCSIKECSSNLDVRLVVFDSKIEVPIHEQYCIVHKRTRLKEIASSNHRLRLMNMEYVVNK